MSLRATASVRFDTQAAHDLYPLFAAFITLTKALHGSLLDEDATLDAVAERAAFEFRRGESIMDQVDFYADGTTTDPRALKTVLEEQRQQIEDLVPDSDLPLEASVQIYKAGEAFIRDFETTYNEDKHNWLQICITHVSSAEESQDMQVPCMLLELFGAKQYIPKVQPIEEHLSEVTWAGLDD